MSILSDIDVKNIIDCVSKNIDYNTILAKASAFKDSVSESWFVDSPAEIQYSTDFSLFSLFVAESFLDFLDKRSPSASVYDSYRDEVISELGDFEGLSDRVIQDLDDTRYNIVLLNCNVYFNKKTNSFSVVLDVTIDSYIYPYNGSEDGYDIVRKEVPVHDVDSCCNDLIETIYEVFLESASILN